MLVKGLNEPTPFIKVGNRSYQGKVTPLIGDEIVLGLQRSRLTEEMRSNRADPCRS